MEWKLAPDLTCTAVIRSLRVQHIFESAPYFW